jgi:hypothetical protein
MKKLIVTLALCAVCAAPALWAYDGGMIGKSFINASYPHLIGKDKSLRKDVFDEACWDHVDLIAPLTGDTEDIDANSIEPLLLSYMCPEVRDVRPPELVRMLPQGRESDLKVGALLYQNLQVATFLRGSNAAAYATLYNQFCADNRSNKADVKSYFDRNIGALVSAEVDAQFNRVEFRLDWYNSGLTRNPQNGQYILSYEDVNDVVKTLTASSLETLLSEMRKNAADFRQSDIDTVRAQAALIPAVRLSNSALNEINSILTSFYTTPNAGTYSAVRDVYALYRNTYIQSDNEQFRIIHYSYENALKSLSADLAEKVYTDDPRISIALSSAQQQRLLALVR